VVRILTEENGKKRGNPKLKTNFESRESEKEVDYPPKIE